MIAEEHRFAAGRGSGDVSALLLRPGDARGLLVFGHGAGAGMRHPFMEKMSRRLAERRIATFLYPFNVLKRSGRTFSEVLDEIADTVADWVSARV